VETLNEALKIAARDIAEAAGDQLLSDEEDEDSEDDVAADGGGVSGKSETTSGGSGVRGGKASASNTVFVNPDGSYNFKKT
jgi:hypothetical protein